MTLAARSIALRPRSERLKAPIWSAAGVAAATVALHIRDPHTSGSWGICPLYATTGIYCPGCGGLRAVNDLTNGHVWQAASSNLLLVLAIPFAVFFFARWSYGAWTGREIAAVPAVPRALRIALLVVVAVFWIARNLPGSWLAP